MAVKTWTSGEVLTASDLNTYAGNPGLVYITQVNPGTSLTSYAVNNVFSSTYDNYRVVYTGYTTSTAEPLKMRLGSQNTGYYGHFFYGAYDTSTLGSVPDSNQQEFRYVAGGNINDAGSVMIMDIFNPNKAQNTTIRSHVVFYSTIVNGTYGGVVFNTTQFTGFTLYRFSSGTFGGGTLTVYGYRQA